MFTLSLLKRSAPYVKKFLLRPTFPAMNFQYKYYAPFCSANDPKINQIFNSLRNISLTKDDPSLKVSDYERILTDLRNSKNLASLTKEEVSMALRLLYKLATASQREHDLQKSLKYYADALALSEKANIIDTIELGYINNSLGHIYLRQDDLEEAEKHLEKAAKVLQKQGTNLEAKSENVQNIYLRGMLQDRKGQSDKALGLYEEALKLTSELQKEDAAQALIALYDSIGFTYEKKGDTKKAIEYWRKGLDSAVVNYGKDAIETKIFEEALAWVEFEQGNLETAVRYAENALRVSIKHHGAEGSGITSSLFLLGDIYSKRGDQKKALEQYERGSKILEKDSNQTPDQRAHPNMIIARSYFGQGNHSKASEFFGKVVDAFKNSSSSEQQVHLADYYINWGNLLSNNILQVAQSRSAFREALEILKKAGSKDTQRLVDIYSHLGEIAYYDDQYEEALKLFQECLNLAKEDKAVEKSLEEVYSFVGDIYMKRNEYNEGVKYHKKALEVCNGKDKEHPDQDFHYRNLGEAYEKVGDLDKAREVYQKALEFAAKRYGKGDETTQRNLGLLVNVLKNQNKTKEIEDLTKNYQ